MSCKGVIMKPLKLAIAAGVFGAAAPSLAAPMYSHVSVVVEENHDYSEVIGNPNMPYLNRLGVDGFLLTVSDGYHHLRQPTYRDLFAGSNQRVTNDKPVPGSSSTQASQTPLTT